MSTISDVIKELVNYMEIIENVSEIRFGKSITTNGALLTEEILNYCEQKKINIRTSIDGDASILNALPPITLNIIANTIITIRKKDRFSTRSFL